MECVNCGEIGHSFRECREPVLSFGVCAVKIVEDTPNYLLIRRRDSLAYVEFMRGKYKLESPDYIQLLMNGMTVEERGRLCSTSFDRLWAQLWNGQNTRQFRNEHDAAKRIFEALRTTGDIRGHQMARFLEGATTSWAEAEWGFPKGRRALHEARRDCALREFREETGFPDTVLHLLEEEPPLVEAYTGTNGIPYRQTYYLGACAATTVAAIQPSNRVMSREVGNIGWFSFEDAMTKIRTTNPEKRALLTALHQRITTEGLRERILGEIEWTTV